MTVNSYRHEFISNSFWKCVVPFKLLVFSWKLLWGWLSARETLINRGCLLNNLVVCSVSSTLTLEIPFFVQCPFSQQVWNAIFLWLGYSMVQINLLQHHYIQFGFLFRGKRLRRVRLLGFNSKYRDPINQPNFDSNRQSSILTTCFLFMYRGITVQR